MLTGSYNNKFGMLKFARIVFSLGAIVLAGCSSQEVYVYEKLPEASECRRYTDYWTVSACNRKHQIKMNEKLDSVIRTTNYRLSRKYNQRDKCKESIVLHRKDATSVIFHRGQIFLLLAKQRTEDFSHFL